jgi:signal transduction histidine kinase
MMRPSAGERWEALGIFVAMAAAAVVLAWVVPKIVRTSRSLASTIAAVALIAVVLIGVAVVLGAWRMFLSSHDLRLLVVVLAFGAGLGVVFAFAVARSLTADLAEIRGTADRVASDDLTAGTGVERADELGAAAAALDAMVARLSAAEAQRGRDEAARRQLLTAVSHDLRTPLAALQAAVEAIEDGVAVDPDRYLRSMSRDIAALSGLVDDLFLLARIDSGEEAIAHDPVDLADVADETIEAMEPVARRAGVDLQLETSGPVPVLGEAEALGRVLRNLVDNAIRHAPSPGHVRVRVLNGDRATVEVIDDGPGFPADLVPVAFDHFVRADPSRSRTTGGAGLGLAIAKGVVVAHGGEIWAAPGPGGRVGFHLPGGLRQSVDG